jgi:inner membrane protease subunit 1
MAFQPFGRRMFSARAGRFRDAIHRYRPPPLIPLGIRVIQVVAAYHFITTTIIDIRLCSGHSMLPTLSYQGDCVVCSPIPYWFPFISAAKRRPKRGDLVVADSPNSLGNTVLKRVIGVEGDVIEIEPRRGVDRKWIAEADESYFGERPSHPGLEGRGRDSEGRPMVHGRRGEGKYIKVPKGYIWVVGDNLSNSTDSRHYGPVPLAMVKGKVLARVSHLPNWATGACLPGGYVHFVLMEPDLAESD